MLPSKVLNGDPALIAVVAVGCFALGLVVGQTMHGACTFLFRLMILRLQNGVTNAE